MDNKKMSDEQINRAIAEACGWEKEFYDYADIPDYCNDPKVMKEAERWLLNIDPESWDEYYCSFEKSLCCSTERQRAENFLKVIGKWEE